MKTSDITDLEVCEAVQKAHENLWKEYAYQIIAKKRGCAEKVAYRAMERASDHGLINFGVSLRTGWLTDKGQILISAGLIIGRFENEELVANTAASNYGGIDRQIGVKL